MILGLAGCLVIIGIAGLVRASAVSLLLTPRADAIRDATEDVRGAEQVADLLDERTLVQPSIGMVHSALLVAATIPGAWAVTRATSGWATLGTLVGLVFVVVLGGDVFPRSYGRSHPATLAYRFATVLTVVFRTGRRAGLLLIEEPDEEDAGVEEEQEEEERRLITSILEFTDTIVREVMVPRPDMVTIRNTDTTDRALDVIIEEGFSRIPVIAQTVDDIVGFVYAKDLLKIMDRGGGPEPVTQLMRPVYFVPETKRVSELLRDMQSRQQHMAIVVDEFGGTAGLVTIEDLLEEIVGEIVDEYDTEEPLLREEEDGSYVVDGRYPVDDLEEILGLELPHEDWDTIGGLVLDLAGRVPIEGETFAENGVSVTVTKVQGRRVTEVRVAAVRGRS